MSYCSLEEAWGSDFLKNNLENPKYYQEINKEDGNIPNYGQELNINSPKTINSDIVPYKVKLPDNSDRNIVHHIDDKKRNKSELSELEDNDNDINYIDKQRNVIEEDNYLTSEDYRLYKKFKNLSEIYKEKLKNKYNIILDEYKKENEDKNEESIENFNFSNNSNDMKDIIIIVLVGIFLIFALDIFVKIGVKSNK